MEVVWVAGLAGWMGPHSTAILQTLLGLILERVLVMQTTEGNMATMQSLQMHGWWVKSLFIGWNTDHSLMWARRYSRQYSYVQYEMEM